MAEIKTCDEYVLAELDKVTKERDDLIAKYVNCLKEEKVEIDEEKDLALKLYKTDVEIYRYDVGSSYNVRDLHTQHPKIFAKSKLKRALESDAILDALIEKQNQMHIGYYDKYLLKMRKDIPLYILQKGPDSYFIRNGYREKLEMEIYNNLDAEKNQSYFTWDRVKDFKAKAYKELRSSIEYCFKNYWKEEDTDESA